MSANHEYLVNMMEDMAEEVVNTGKDAECLYNGHTVRFHYRVIFQSQWFVDGVAMTFQQALAKLAV